eukprot:COSAG02_NODE_5267_length_4484_cov_40.310376_1_plen_464_part_10
MENYYLPEWLPYQKRGTVVPRGENVPAKERFESDEQRNTLAQPQFYQEFERVLIHGKKDSIRTPDKEPIVSSIEKLRKQMPNGDEPLTADLVAKMILRLSKARQLKRRLQWTGGGTTGRWFPPLYLISIGHASIPYVFTFVTTLPVSTGIVAIATVCAVLVGSCMNEEIRVRKAKDRMTDERLKNLRKQQHEKAVGVTELENRAEAAKIVAQREKEEFEKTEKWLEDERRRHNRWKQVSKCALTCWKVLCALGFVLWLVLGLFAPNESFLSVDTCGAILDTQGQCCYRNGTMKVASTLPLLNGAESEAFCCPSYFNPDSDDSWEVSLVVPKAIFKHVTRCKLCEFSHGVSNGSAALLDDADPSAGGVPEEYFHSDSVCFGQDWLESRLDPANRVANLFPEQSDLTQPAMTTIGGWCEAVNDKNPEVHFDYLVAPRSYAHPGKRLSACVIGFDDRLSDILGLDAN